jgi:hypothetical protein
MVGNYYTLVELLKMPFTRDIHSKYKFYKWSYKQQMHYEKDYIG